MKLAGAQRQSEAGWPGLKVRTSRAMAWPPSGMTTTRSVSGGGLMDDTSFRCCSSLCRAAWHPQTSVSIAVLGAVLTKKLFQYVLRATAYKALLSVNK